MSRCLTVKRSGSRLGTQKTKPKTLPQTSPQSRQHFKKDNSKKDLLSICLDGMFGSIRRFQSNTKWKQEHQSDAMFLVATLFSLIHKMSSLNQYRHLLSDWDRLLYQKNANDDDVVICAAVQWRKQLSSFASTPSPSRMERSDNKTTSCVEWHQFCKQNQTSLFFNKKPCTKSSSVSMKIHNATVALTLQYISSSSSLSISELFTECKQFVNKWNFQTFHNKQQQFQTCRFASEPKHLSFKIYFVFHWLACSTDWGQTKLNQTHPRYSEWIESNILLHWFQEFGNIQSKFKNDIETIAELLGCFCMLGSTSCTFTTEMESWITIVIRKNKVEQYVRIEKHYHAYYLLSLLLLLTHTPEKKKKKMMDIKSNDVTS